MKFHSSYCCGTKCSAELIADLEYMLNKTITVEMLQLPEQLQLQKESDLKSLQ